MPVVDFVVVAVVVGCVAAGLASVAGCFFATGFSTLASFRLRDELSSAEGAGEATGLWRALPRSEDADLLGPSLLWWLSWSTFGAVLSPATFCCTGLDSSLEGDAVDAVDSAREGWVPVVGGTVA